MSEQESTRDTAAPHGGTFGDELRREREIRGISLKEIADATKVSRRFLEAIERNDFKNLPAPVFTRGFIREYARYLGLNADDMINHYMQFVQLSEAEEEQKSGPVMIPAHRLLPLGKSIPRTSVDGNVVLFGIILIALTFASFWAYRYLHGENRQSPEVRDSGKTPEPEHVQAAPTAVPPVAVTSTEAGPVRLQLTVDLTGTSWIALMADGKSVVNDELKKGDHRTYEAEHEFRLKTIGNAGGVELTLNGVRLPPLGKEGEVVHDRVFDRSSLDKTPPRTAS